MNQSSKSLNNWFLILAVVGLAIAPLMILRDAEFGGADGQAEEVITEIQPEYEPWFASIFEPASGEIESLLFSSQAAVGAGVIGYAIGLYKGRSQQQPKE
jgi:cobalt/nickel transport protein